MAKLPDQRHLRRAADAASFEDSNKPVTVAVEVKKSAPFNAVVFDPPPQDIAAEIDKLNESGDHPYVAIQCRTEESALRSEAVRNSAYVIMHDWWSPLASWRTSKGVQRANVAEYVLQLKDSDGQLLDEVSLTNELRLRNQRQADRVQPDAIFLSFEALDKFLFPQLASTYGVKGAWTERNRIRRELGDEVKTDAEEASEDVAVDLMDAGQHRKSAAAK